MTQGDLTGAIACFHKALEVKPKFALAHNNLGNALRDQADLAGALASYHKALEFNPKLPSVEQSAQQAKRLIALEPQLPEILSGRREPASVAERSDFADLCRYKKFHSAAARFYTEAFADDDKVSDHLKANDRYWAAASAVRAAAGQGHDTYKLNEAERAQLRRQALDWLRAALAFHANQFETGKAQDRTRAQQVLRYRQRYPDLTSVRDATALAQLPADERAAWQQLWADVAPLLKKAGTLGSSSGN
jgi:tetratricopeptide (TPR) repeat protein